MSYTDNPQKLLVKSPSPQIIQNARPLSICPMARPLPRSRSAGTRVQTCRRLLGELWSKFLLGNRNADMEHPWRSMVSQWDMINGWWIFQKFEELWELIYQLNFKYTSLIITCNYSYHVQTSKILDSFSRWLLLANLHGFPRLLSHTTRLATWLYSGAARNIPLIYGTNISIY